jgi:hypothetical protein
MPEQLARFMKNDQMTLLGVESMSEEQCQALYDWGMSMYSLGRTVVGDIRNIKYGGRLIILDDGTKWEVDETDTTTSNLWSVYDKVIIIDDDMYKLDDSEKVEVARDRD